MYSDRRKKRIQRKQLRRIILVVLITFIVVPLSFGKYIEIITATISLSIRKPVYSVKFYSNRNDGNPDEMTTQTGFVYGTMKKLAANTFTKQGSNFSEWNTEADGSGTSYTDKQEVDNLTTHDGEEVELYAQWTNGVAQIDGVSYTTLQSAINAVPTDGTVKTVLLVADVTENLTIAEGKNFTLDLNNHTVTYAISPSSNIKEALITNNGTVRIKNGTLTSASVRDGAVNNEATGNLTLENVNLSMTATGGKQALYNNGGTVEIKGNSYLFSASNPADLTKIRATAQNKAGGTLTVSGGTIVSESYHGIVNEGTMVIGTEDGNPDKTDPIVQGLLYGVSSTVGFNFFNGTLKGGTKPVDNESLITNIETNYYLAKEDEDISGYIYRTLYQASTVKTVTFNPNQGTVNEPTRSIEPGHAVGTLPIPVMAGFSFDGWFTAASGGTEITPNTIINQDIEYFAHWTSSVGVAEVNGTPYSTLQDAVSSVPKDNTETIVKLNQDVSEFVTVAQGQKIIFDFQNHTLTNSGNNPIIQNDGTVTINDGIFSSTATNGAIDNNRNKKGAKLYINGGTVTATQRAAVYNYGGGTVVITGGTFRSSTTGTPSGTTMERGTVQNLSGGTITITGGTIIGTKQQAVSNEGTLILGTEDGSIDATSPEIIGEKHGLKTTGTLRFYDGIIKGITDSVYGTITSIQANATEVDSTETISGKTYYTKHLSF